MSDATAEVLAQAAATIREAARVHKRAEAQHRRHARELMQQLDRLRAICAEHDITLKTT